MMKRCFGHLSILMMAGSCLCCAGEKSETVFLKDADSYVGKAPLIPKITPEPSATPRTRATPTPITIIRHEVADGDDETSRSERSYPAAVVHRSTITVGQQVPVPKLYVAPQVVPLQGGGVTVVPATPVSFEKVQTGVILGNDGSGNVSLRETEVNGLVNYGTPIRTVSPVYDPLGRPTGTQAITVSPNPVLVPVTTTVEVK